MNKKSALAIIDERMEDSPHKEALKTYLCNLVSELKIRQDSEAKAKSKREELRKKNYKVRNAKHKNRKVL